MSEKLCALRKIGGGTELKETTLWTNATPSSSYAGGTITLSQSIDDFIEVAVYFRAYKTDAIESFVKYTVEEFKEFISTGSTTHAIATISARRGTSASYVREAFYYDGTSIIFGACNIVRTTSTDNNYVIPTKIVGLK